MPQEIEKRGQRLKFSLPGFCFYARLLPGKSPVIQGILENLPTEGRAERWGEEVYFFVEWSIPNESGTVEVEAGDIGFWPPGPAIAIFFGKTPLSKGTKPMPASEVNLFAKIENLDEALSHLRKVKTGEKITVSKAK